MIELLANELLLIIKLINDLDIDIEEISIRLPNGDLIVIR